MNDKMRVYHRYLGFFLAGIMAVYASSGVIMIFRDTDFLKRDKKIEKQIAQNLTDEQLGEALDIDELHIKSGDDVTVVFDQGTYNRKTGQASYVVKKLPYFVERLTHLHKASVDDPLFFLNIFFGFSLLFFVVSAFYMFLPETSVFKKGLYFAAAGIVLTLIMLFV